MSNRGEWLTATEARELLGVSRGKFADLIKRGLLTKRESPMDRRISLILRGDVERLANEPRAVKKEVA